ncbi:MAG: hypothetical protein ABIK40_04495 [candidate division WOR-3 bacterium]
MCEITITLNFEEIKKVLSSSQSLSKDVDVEYDLPRKLIDEYWDKNLRTVSDVATLFLIAWNNAAFRYGGFKPDKLKGWVEENRDRIDGFRKREITSLNENDKKCIKEMYETLATCILKTKKRQFIAAAKTLHILAPSFFPVWDNKVAEGLRFRGIDADNYVKFCVALKDVLERERENVEKLKKWYYKEFESTRFIYGYSQRTILKILDEYFYLKFTRGVV